MKSDPLNASPDLSFLIPVHTTEHTINQTQCVHRFENKGDQVVGFICGTQLGSSSRGCPPPLVVKMFGKNTSDLNGRIDNIPL